MSVLPLVETAGDLAARTYGSCHVAMMKLRTYKCNSLDCFDSNMCLIYYSCHGAMMNMVILRTYKCNSLHCFDSNVFNILQLPCGDDEYDDIADL